MSDIQKSFFVAKNTFENLRNPAGGAGRTMPLDLMTQILNQAPPDYPTYPPIPGADAPAIKPGWVIIHRWKTWAEELFIRLTDNNIPTRPAKEFSHYPIYLFKDIIAAPYSPTNKVLDTPVSFTFVLAFTKTEKDVIFSVKCPIKNTPGMFENLYFAKSIIPDMTATDALTANAKSTSALNHPTKMAGHTDDSTVDKGGDTEDIWNFLSPDQEECQEIAASHSIDSGVFSRYLNNFWEGYSVPKAFCISWNTLQQLCSQPENATKGVRLQWDDGDHSSNAMDVGFEEDPYLSAPAMATGRLRLVDYVMEQQTSYSVKLFYGIYYLNTTIRFRLYKAQDDEGNKTILIESIGLNGHAYYDLSSEHP